MKAQSSPDSTAAPQFVPSDVQLLMNDVYYFAETFTARSTEPVIEWILARNLLPRSQRPKHLHLIINSPGGTLHSCFALIDVMRGSAIPVHTTGLGLVASCGLITFMAGEKGYRVLTPNTSILSHQYSGGAVGKEHELVAAQREQELTADRLIDLYKKCTGLPQKKVRELLLPASDLWMTAKEAVAYGLADKVIDIK
jgi:ATP-dependent Clp protease protease subunit